MNPYKEKEKKTTKIIKIKHPDGMFLLNLSEMRFWIYSIKLLKNMIVDHRLIKKTATHG